MKRLTGFSLIELMIAMTLGLIAIAAVGSVFIYGSRNYKQDDKVSKMQDNLRFAMAQMVQDVEMAGFWGAIQSPSANISISGLNIQTDCGVGGAAWALNFNNAIDVADNISPTAGNAAYPCIPVSDLYTGTTDILGVHRLMGGSIPSPLSAKVANGTVIMRTNGSVGTVYQYQSSGSTPGPLGIEGASATPPVSGATIDVYQLYPVLWYVSSSATTTAQRNNMNQSIPALCRMKLTTDVPPKMQRECVAEGIENMQVEFGLDTDNDGSPNQWVSGPSAAQLGQAIAVRISLLGRSSDSEAPGVYTNQKSYTLGNVWTAASPYTPNDRFYRRTLTATVLLRNPAHVARPYALQ